jgi:mutator family transposase
VIFVDAIHVKIRDGQVANRPIYVAIAVTADGYREILGLWAGDGCEGVKCWQQVLTDLRNRGVKDVLMLVCDGLTALPDAVANVWPQTVVQQCVVHGPSRPEWRPSASMTGRPDARSCPDTAVKPEDADVLSCTLPGIRLGRQTVIAAIVLVGGDRGDPSHRPESESTCVDARSWPGWQASG